MCEGVTRLGFDRISRIQRRMAEERAAASSTFSRNTSVSGNTVLLVGNSLILEGVDPDQFHSGLLPVGYGLRYVVEQSDYYDWYYGLKRLFREGVRPRYVAIGLAPFQLNSENIRGDYSAYYLFSADDIMRYARDSRLGLTTTSGLLLAHFSRSYAVRTEMRVFLLTRFFPTYVAMLHAVTTQPAQRVSDESIEAASVKKLSALADLCSTYDVKPILVVPPTGYGGEAAVTSASRSSGVPVVIPVPRDEFGSEYFQSDHFHLNEKGRSIFTARLVEKLRTQLN